MPFQRGPKHGNKQTVRLARQAGLGRSLVSTLLGESPGGAKYSFSSCESCMSWPKCATPAASMVVPCSAKGGRLRQFNHAGNGLPYFGADRRREEERAGMGPRETSSP